MKYLLPLLAIIVLIITGVLIVGNVLPNNASHTSGQPHDMAMTESTTNPAEGRKLPPVTVVIVPNGFAPSTVTITTGQTVIWVNSDTVSHQLVFDDSMDDGMYYMESLPELDPIDAHGAATYPFDSHGKLTYHDKANPSLKGTVIVK